MKLHCFYLPYQKYKFAERYDLDDESVVLLHNEPYYMYAYTTDKSIASQFITIRNMDLFLYKKLDVNEEELCHFEMRFNTSGLSMVEIPTNTEIGYYNIALTDFELDAITYSFMDTIIEGMRIPDPMRVEYQSNALQSEFYDALLILEYQSRMAAMFGMYPYEEITDGWDIFAIFVYGFSELLD